MRYLVAVVLLASAAARAQSPPEPDTLAWRGYFPLAVGNVWEYRLYLYRPATIYRPQNESRTEYVRFRVTGTEPSDGDGPFTLVEDRLSDAGVLLRRDTHTVRYDPGTASVVARYPLTNGEGTYDQQVPSFACNLNLQFGGRERRPCWISATREANGVPLFLGSAATLRAKSFFNFVYGFTAVHGVGFVSGGGGCEPCSSFSDYESWSLTYARVGAAEYGAYAVSAEGTAPPAARLRAYPNPVEDWLTVSGEGERVEVYDVLGRLVRVDRVVSQTATQLDVRGLGAGMYVVRRGRESVVVTVE